MRTLLCILVALCYAAASPAQQFTRLTVGEIVSDGGSSRAACFIDYDNDGDLDAFITNSEAQSEFLYRNDGGLNFVRITDDPIATAGGDSDGATFGDIDNDGDLDCFFTNWNNQFNRLFQNNGDGTFSPVGAAPITTQRGYCETGSWGDYDNDGNLDLFVTHSAGQNHRNRLFHNDGDWMFTERTTGDFTADHYDSRSADWCDFDDDGDLDIFTANESSQNDQLYVNSGGGLFIRSAQGPLVTDGSTTMTSSWADYDNDGDFDLFTGNHNGQQHRLYQNDGDGSFTQVTTGPIVETAGWTFGSAWGDYDNDGDLDLFLANGWQGLHTNSLYENLGNGQFAEVTGEPIVTDSGWGYGCTWGDADRDGDLDLLVACWYQDNENNRLYINNGNGNNWLTVKCEGVISNGSGIGARIRVKATIGGESVWQLRQVAGQTGYCGQTLEAHFGLASAAIIDSLVILWPSGTEDVYRDVTPNQVITAIEGDEITAVRAPVIPQSPELLSAFPNPFNGDVTLSFSLAHRTDYRLTAFDLLGREVQTITGGTDGPGDVNVTWSPKNLGAGTYVVKLSGTDDSGSVKVVYLK